jgi:1-phosphatidylinositol-3-phosphate 5-kinase
VLAKIYGFFKIGYRNAVTGRSMRMNVLIMENLFYDRRFSKVSTIALSLRHVLIARSMTLKAVLGTG